MDTLTMPGPLEFALSERPQSAAQGSIFGFLLIEDIDKQTTAVAQEALTAVLERAQFLRLDSNTREARDPGDAKFYMVIGLFTGRRANDGRFVVSNVRRP